MRLIFIAGIPGLDLSRWSNESLALAGVGGSSPANKACDPVIVEDLFSMTAIARKDVPDQRLSSFLDLPPDDLNRVCSKAITEAIDKACSSDGSYGVICFHPVLYQSETRTFLAPYSSAALSQYIASKNGVETIFFSLHDDTYDVCRRLQGITRKGDLHMFHPRRTYAAADDEGTLARDPLRDIQNLLFLLDWRDRELMASQALAAAVPSRHILFHRKGRASVFWNIAIKNAPAVYFSHPISQARRDLTGKAHSKKSKAANPERGRKLMDACNSAAGKLAAEHVPLIEPTSIDEYRVDKAMLPRVSAKVLKQCFLPPLTPRWTLGGDRVDLPDAWAERDHLTSFAEDGISDVKWTGPTVPVKSLGPAIDILQHEIVRQITERDHKLTQQAELVVAYRPYSLPDQPTMTGGVETEIMAMLRKAHAGKPCCRPAIIVIHSREDEVARRHKEFAIWWRDNEARWFKGRLPKQGDQLRTELEAVVTDLSTTSDRSSAKHAIVSLLEKHRVLPASKSTAGAAMASGEYSDQQTNRGAFADLLVDSTVIHSVLETKMGRDAGIAEVWMEEDCPDFARRVAEVVARGVFPA